ncbi:Gfo/Idh/MocA family oxidoreductase [Marinilongibacter aquaticus]|nr:Gfo/Idh/MocA family oxidoreductase [Marinilongibacter aquaticus]UBM57983.1 Gfo/Idh/MocA family oxidoreductase [Marinilongibacter aquaticus]
MKRREFIEKGAMLGASPFLIKPFNILNSSKFSPNDKIRLATIGMGIQGHYDTNAALANEGVEHVAVADLYQGRLNHMKELHGNKIDTYRDYRELLQRKDIDAVIIATTDLWHDTITKDALKAGKHVYCEKPMVHKIEQGSSVIEAWKKSGKTMQVGSQRVSGSDFAEARRLISEGAIGEINYIEASYDRFSSIGAWNYSIPLDASPETIDWDTYLKDTAKVPFDPKKFFRWRAYKDFGTGVAGDLFVHLISGVHYAVQSNGPSRIFASGGLRYWKDGRNMPDVMVGILDYEKSANHPAFQLVMRVDFANAGTINNTTRIIGSEGQIEFIRGGLKLTKHKLPKAPGMGGYDSLFTIEEKQQKAYEEMYNAKYSEADRKAEPIEEVVFKNPEGPSEHVRHFGNFFENARKGSQNTIEDPVFGFRAAAPVLACNKSYFERKPVEWDAEKMKLK